jgi:octaprenyl-diphosphate synthase
VAEVIAFVLKSGGIEYASAKMREYQSAAISILETFPESEFRKALVELVDYSIDRKK